MQHRKRRAFAKHSMVSLACDRTCHPAFWGESIEQRDSCEASDSERELEKSKGQPILDLAQQTLFAMMRLQ